MNPFGIQDGSSRVDVDGGASRPDELSTSSGGGGVKVDGRGPAIITLPGSGVDRATVSSMLQELEDKFEKRMAEEREARRESEEMLKDCIEKLMEELCQVALIVTGKREDEDDPSRARENITKRLGIMFREVRIRLGKWKGDDESWETREEMYLGIKRELGLENSEGVVQDARLNEDGQPPQPVSGQSSSVPEVSDVMPSPSRSSGQREQEDEISGGEKNLEVPSNSVLEGVPDARLGPPYLRLRRIEHDPAIFPAENAREANTPAPRNGRTANANGKPHSTRNPQDGSKPKVGGSKQAKESRGVLKVPDPQPEQEGNFVCPTCTKAYSIRSQLNRHMEIRHSNSSDRPLQCPRCPARFKLKSHLTSHMVVHSDRKPFKCPKCPARFKRSNQVKAHMLWVHSNRRPFKCQVCGTGFKFSSNLTTHFRVHTGERPYSCHICNKAFTDSRHLNGHVRTHLGEEGKIYQCHFCTMKFVHSSNCRVHQRRHHSSELESKGKP